MGISLKELSLKATYINFSIDCHLEEVLIEVVFEKDKLHQIRRIAFADRKELEHYRRQLSI